jgi:hypothetical protein
MFGLSRGTGVVVDRFAVSLLFVFGGLGIVDSIVAGVCLTDWSSGFFLPKPKNPRFLVLEELFPVSCSDCCSVSTVGVGVNVPVEDGRSPKSEAWFFSWLLFIAATGARLMVADQSGIKASTRTQG